MDDNRIDNIWMKMITSEWKQPVTETHYAELLRKVKVHHKYKINDDDAHFIVGLVIDCALTLGCICKCREDR